MKPGYKQTEVGVIPEEWEVLQLSNHFRINAAGVMPKHSLSNVRSETHPNPIFSNALQGRGAAGVSPIILIF
jgi:type I restriction enzyme S subunit